MKLKLIIHNKAKEESNRDKIKFKLIKVIGRHIKILKIMKNLKLINLERVT